MSFQSDQEAKVSDPIPFEGMSLYVGGLLPVSCKFSLTSLSTQVLRSGGHATRECSSWFPALALVVKSPDG